MLYAIIFMAYAIALAILWVYNKKLFPYIVRTNTERYGDNHGAMWHINHFARNAEMTVNWFVVILAPFAVVAMAFGCSIQISILNDSLKPYKPKKTTMLEKLFKNQKDVE